MEPTHQTSLFIIVKRCSVRNLVSSKTLLFSVRKSCAPPPSGDVAVSSRGPEFRKHDQDPHREQLARRDARLCESRSSGFQDPTGRESPRQQHPLRTGQAEIRLRGAPSRRHLQTGPRRPTPGPTAAGVRTPPRLNGDVPDRRNKLN